MLVALVSFLLKPKATLAGIQRARTDFDAQGRCVDPSMWADGLNADGTRKDGQPLGTKLSWTAMFR